MKFLPVLLMLASATLASAQLAGPQLPSSGSNVNFHLVASGQHSRARRPGMFVLNGAADLQRYWQQVLARNPQGIPAVDWINQRVVVVNLGLKQTGGYSVSISTVRRAIQQAVVTATVHDPIPGQYVAPNPTSPWTMIAIDRGPYNFTLDWNHSQTIGNGITVLSFAGGRTCGCGAKCPCKCGCGG